MNALRLLPVFLLVVAVFVTGYEAYHYFHTGQREDITLLVVGSIVMIYASFRTIFAVRRVFVWSDEQ